MTTESGEVLVAIMNNRLDFRIAREQGWYRIPTDSVNKFLRERWPPRWLAFYQTKVFGQAAFSVRYYAEITEIKPVRRGLLFPHEAPGPKSDKQYQQLCFASLRRLPAPIFSRRWRRIVFIPTTWEKFVHAHEINDLYDGSPLEDRLWAEFKRLQIPAERQEPVGVRGCWYFLDFAIYCLSGKLAVEADGDSWHNSPEQIEKDKLRDSNLEAMGWCVLRFNTQQIKEQMDEYCLPEITLGVERLGGVSG